MLCFGKQFQYVGQAGLELEILLPSLPKCSELQICGIADNSVNIFLFFCFREVKANLFPVFADWFHAG